VLKRFMGMLGILYIHHPTLSFAGALLMDKPAPYEQCGYCHEYDGNPSMGSYPKLAGQKKSYLLKQLLDYKLGQRDGRGMMETAASMLSDQDMQVVTEFFSKQKRTLDGVTSTGVDYAHAREIYTQGDRMRQIIACKLCHTSSDPRIPYLTGQHAEYLSMQLHAFKNKTRTNDEATIMQFIAERLTDDEITQLSQYLATGEDQQ
jgi:cytochrome c553